MFVKTWVGCTGSANAIGQFVQIVIPKRNNCHSNAQIVSTTHPGCGMSSDPKCPFNTIGKKYCDSGGNSCQAYGSGDTRKCNKK